MMQQTDDYFISPRFIELPCKVSCAGEMILLVLQYQLVVLEDEVYWVDLYWPDHPTTQIQRRRLKYMETRPACIELNLWLVFLLRFSLTYSPDPESTFPTHIDMWPAGLELDFWLVLFSSFSLNCDISFYIKAYKKHKRQLVNEVLHCDS